MVAAPKPHRLRLDIDGLKARYDLVDIAHDLGLGPFKGRGKEKSGPCPGCEKSGKFSISSAKGMGFCFSCNFKCDVISLVQDIKNCTFMAAVKYLDGDVKPSEEERRARESIRKKREQAEAQAKADKTREDAVTITKIMGECQSGAGTLAEEYYIERGCDLVSAFGEWPKDLLFHPGLEAFGGKVGARFSVGKYPAIIGVPRDRRDGIPALHKTFIEPASGDQPVRKASPKDKEGDQVENWNAKQMIGAVGAADAGVYLGAIGPKKPDGSLIDEDAVWFVGEGLESVASVACATSTRGEEGDSPTGSGSTRGEEGDSPTGSGSNPEHIEGYYAAALSLNGLRGTFDPANPKASKGWVPPRFKDTVCVLADNDFSDITKHDGTEIGGAVRAKIAFEQVARRLTGMGHPVHLAFPPLGMDFNDLLLNPQSKEGKMT